MVEELVSDLRDMAENLQVPVPKNAEGYVYYAEAMLAIRAADTLEALRRENEELKYKVEELRVARGYES